MGCFESLLKHPHVYSRIGFWGLALLGFYAAKVGSCLQGFGTAYRYNHQGSGSPRITTLRQKIELSHILVLFIINFIKASRTKTMLHKESTQEYTAQNETQCPERNTLLVAQKGNTLLKTKHSALKETRCLEWNAVLWKKHVAQNGTQCSERNTLLKMEHSALKGTRCSKWNTVLWKEHVAQNGTQCSERNTLLKMERSAMKRTCCSKRNALLKTEHFAQNGTRCSRVTFHLDGDWLSLAVSRFFLGTIN